MVMGIMRKPAHVRAAAPVSRFDVLESLGRFDECDARLLPLLELVGVGHAQSASLSKEVREQLAALQSGRQETRLALQDQALEIKQLEDQIARLREASEKSQLEQTRLAESVKSLRSLLLTAGAGLAVLTTILIVIVAVLLARGGR